MQNRVVAYHRAFPWRRICEPRSGTTSAERILRMHARANGLRVVQFVVETDSSLRRAFEDRIGGRAAMQCLRAGEAAGLLVQRPEHIFSSAADALYALERWLDEGYAFHCVQFFQEWALSIGLGFAAPDGDTLVRGLADLQRTTDMERARQEIRTGAVTGKWKGRVPFGFHLVDGRLMEESDRIERIVQMKQAHRRGKSYRHIAQAQGVSVATAHRLIRTDLRKLRTLSGRAVPPASG